MKRKNAFCLFMAVILIMAKAPLSQAATPMVAAGDGYVVGLKADGTVVAAGSYPCKVNEWNLKITDSGGDNDDGNAVGGGGSSDGGCFINVMKAIM